MEPFLRFRAFSFNSTTLIFVCDACEAVKGQVVIKKALPSVELTL